jgi:hypothetical protein
MSTVQEIKDAVQQLPPDELAASRAWFAEFDAAAWDRQFEADVAAGRLEKFADEAPAANPQIFHPDSTRLP